MKAGIVGGIGPESTLDYYRTIIHEYRRRTDGPNYPQLVIDNIDMSEMLHYVAEMDLERMSDQLLRSLNHLKAAGADFGAIACNTAHVVFDHLRERSPIPLISIVEETCRYAHHLSCRKVLLTGTSFTMRTNFFQQEFDKYGISSIVPDPEDQTSIDGIIFPELEEGIVVPEKKDRMLGICNKLIEHHRIDGVVLGCTELPIMIKAHDLPVTVLNTTRIHIDSIVNTMLDNQSK
ncbi:MAG: amino acid racemase [Candidatus Delongbacteria bacterium]|nr:amino acid racemase [Candidatus Delongbacteria bacterium]